MDYVLAVTTIPLQCRVEAPNKIHFQFGGPTTPERQLAELRKAKTKEPNNPGIRIELARLLEQTQDRAGAIRELKHLVTDFPNVADGFHELGHMQERDEAYESAVLSFQKKALDLNSQEFKNYRCYGKCLYAWAKSMGNATVKKSTLEKAKRLLERASVIGGANSRTQVSGDIFLVDEALAETERDSGTAQAGAA